MGFGLGIDFPLATNAVAGFVVQRRRKPERRSTSGKWPVCFDNRCLFGAFAAASVGYREEQLWRYGIFIGAIFAVIFRFCVTSLLVNPQCGPHASGVPGSVRHSGKTLWCSSSRCGMGTTEAKFSEKAENKYSGGYASYLMIVTANAPSLAVSWQPAGVAI